MPLNQTAYPLGGERSEFTDRFAHIEKVTVTHTFAEAPPADTVHVEAVNVPGVRLRDKILGVNPAEDLVAGLCLTEPQVVGDDSVAISVVNPTSGSLPQTPLGLTFIVARLRQIGETP